MERYSITITGTTPLLMHWDNIEWADTMDEWKADPANKKTSKAGDDRSPAWRWLGSVYHDGTHVGVPNDNLMRCLMEGGAMVPVPGGKNGKTFKAQTQSGMMVNETHWPLTIDGQLIPWPELWALHKEPSISAHKAAARAAGFDLFFKRAKIGASKHIRVRPRFDRWQCTGSISVWDEQIKLSVLRDLFGYAGRYKGLGDWRPGGKTPGPFGMFEAAIKPQ